MTTHGKAILTVPLAAALLLGACAVYDPYYPAYSGYPAYPGYPGYPVYAAPVVVGPPVFGIGIDGWHPGHHDGWHHGRHY